MAKYIDVESLVVGYSGHTPDDEFSQGVDFVLDLLDSKTPADVRPVVRGRWIVHYDDIWPTESTQECSECHGEVPLLIDCKFCPNCGANMKEETKE